MKEKISITRALVSLKLMDKKILKATSSANFANYTVGGKSKLDVFEPVKYLQKVQDLINYRAQLKTAIMVSNSKTNIKIGKNKMTVVEAIETKDSIKYKRQLLTRMKSDVSDVEESVEYGNVEVQQRLDKMLNASFGRESKPNESDLAVISKPFLTKNEYKSVDNAKVQETIDLMEDEIDTFEAEVDMCLSESNAITLIEV